MEDVECKTEEGGKQVMVFTISQSGQRQKTQVEGRMEEKTRKPEAKEREAKHTAENPLYRKSVGTLRVSRNIHIMYNTANVLCESYPQRPEGLMGLCVQLGRR